jgi:hypothetical protein
MRGVTKPYFVMRLHVTKGLDMQTLISASSHSPSATKFRTTGLSHLLTFPPFIYPG